MPRHSHPIAKIRVGKWPQSPHGTIYIEIDANDGTGAKCTLEIQSSHFGSMLVKMHAPQGRVHLCSPVQCVWASSNAKDREELAAYRRRIGQFPSYPESDAADVKDA